MRLALALHGDAKLPTSHAPALLLLGGAHAADYCDGRGGITQTYRGRSDPSCKTN